MKSKNIKGFSFLALTSIVSALILNPLAVFAWRSDPSPSKWMSSIDGKLSLSELSIPGTHDSGARHGLDAVQCQKLTISEQLNAGVRFLDIRLRNFKNALVVHHGKYYQHLNFDDVISECTDFLKANPKEAIIMSVKEEYKSHKATLSFADTFKTYYDENSSLWYTTSSIPTLETVRGKIVLMKRFSGGNLGMAFNGWWKDNTTFSVGTVARVQDQYKCSTNDKKTAIGNLLKETNSDTTKKLYLNYTSGYSRLIPKISKFSGEINPALLDLLNNQKGRVGIVAMDYVNADLASAVYKHNNFK